MADQVFYEVARWQLEQQLAEIRELNGRLMGVFTGATALLVLFAALQNLGQVAESDVSIGLASGAVGLYAALLLTAVLGYRHPELQLGPLPEDLQTAEDTDENDSQVKLDAATAFQRSVTANAPLVRRKAQLVYVAVVLWAADAMLLLGAALTSSA